MKNVKKALAILLVISLMIPLASCEVWREFWDEFNRGDNTDKKTTTTTTAGDGDDPVVPPEANMKLDDYTMPFWIGDTAYDECVMLVAETDGDGNVIGAPRAKLLFEAEEIESVKWYYHENNGGRIVEFVEGEDFVYEDGYIVAKGSTEYNDILDRTEFSTSMPYVTDKMLTGEQQFPGLPLISDIPSKTTGLYLPFTEAQQIVQMQLSVTYKHAEGVWDGYVPEYFGDTVLTRTHEKLVAREEVNLLVYGDSISLGHNTSDVLGIAPNLPTWPEMLAEQLSSYYGADVKLNNASVAGWTASNAVYGGLGYYFGQAITRTGLADQFESGELVGYVPDIAIVGFGMNDASAGIEINTYCNNIMSIISTLRSVNPECEIILVGTILANPLALNQSKNQAEFTEYLKKLAERYEGVCVVDMGATTAELMESGKRYTEMSSNNVNHPNDYLARIYVMDLISALIDLDYEVTMEKTAYEKYTGSGYDVLFGDPFLENGIEALDANGDSSGVLGGLEASADPSWVLAQWGSKYDICDFADRIYSNDGKSFRYTSKGKSIGGVSVPAKVIGVDSEGGSIYMELNAQVEYDAPRKDGEGWPHTLLSQEFSAPLVHVSELSDLVMNMTYEITKFEDCMGDSADSDKHCAQLVWYITLQNRTEGHEDYGKYVWFGITLWDNRLSGASYGGYAAEDAGKDDATHAFIYQPSSALVHAGAGGKCPTVGERRVVDFHLLDAARAAFDTAKQRGYLGSTEWEDLYIGGMNFGFEVTGTYNVATEIESVGVYYK